ncbi:MAG: EAL domain-containing protein [Gammaproteobacteria bacterium]|nr:EAL domain-containing protein [Gammaproteobacteria bacterium]
MAAPRLSLRWQVVIGLMLVLSLLLAVSQYLAWHNLSGQLEQRNLALLSRQQSHFHLLLEGLAERLSLEVEALLIPETVDNDGLGQVVTHINHHWSRQALLLGLEGAVVFDGSGRQLQQWGEIRLPLPAGWAALLQPAPQPFTRIRCDPLCYHYVGVPLAVAGGGALVVSESLTDLLVTLRQLHDADVALLVRVAGRPGLQLISLSRPELNQAVVERLLDRFDDASRSQQPLVVNDGQRQLRLLLRPLDGIDGDGFVLLLQDETEVHRALQQLARHQLLAIVAVVGLALLLAWIFALWLAGRLRSLALALPLLVSQQFDEARRLLRPRKRWWQDELGDLERAAREVTDQLAGLADTVAQRTAALERLALNDELTELPNRIGLQRQLSELLAEPTAQRVVVILIDLDHFKRINDTLGYGAGDELLLIIARRLQVVAGGEHLLARFGGDELVMVACGLSDEVIEALLRIIHLQIHQPASIGRQPLVIEASMGVAVAVSGIDAPQPEVLLRQAEAAMFTAKERGRGHWCRFDPAMLNALSADLSIEQALRQALRKQEFVLHVQPQIALASRRLTGFEVLIRWHHPERGLIYPDDFIPALEQSEQIVPVGYWTIDQSLLMLARLEATGYPGLKMAVNLCSRQFNDPQLPDFIAERLRYHGINGAQLELELTENTLIGAFDETLARIEALRSQGLTLAIDDFGSGYSSLNYLRLLPVDLLKIDRSFVMECHERERDRKLVATILDLARNLEVAVVAEGIELLPHVEFLAANGCQFGQGYLISRPFASSDLLGVLGRQVHHGVWQL